MLTTYEFTEVDTYEDGSQSTFSINISDANYVPISQGNSAKQTGITFNTDVGLFYNTETQLLQFWNGTSWKTVTFLA